jgi:hypothetical protein
MVKVLSPLLSLPGSIPRHRTTKDRKEARHYKKEKYKSRELILDVEDGKYPQVVALETSGDRCDSLDQYRPGDVIKATFDVRGREWQGPNGVKVFTTLALWKVEVITKGAALPASSGGGGDSDDLPFASCAIEHEPSSIAKVLR